MEGLMHAVGKVFKANEFNDDDIVDRLNHHFTVVFLVVAMVVVTTTQYVGSPINCWCPAYFTDSHIDFTNKVSYRSLVDNNELSGTLNFISFHLNFHNNRKNAVTEGITKAK